jgi:hypothetical protein
MTRNANISAVHDDDLIGFLDGLGVLSDVKFGAARCKFCHESINLTNLAAVFPESGDVKFVCDKPRCLSLLAEYRSELRGRDTAVQAQPEAGPNSEVAQAKAHGGTV